MVAFLGLLLIACWRPDDRLLPAVFFLFALAILDRRGPAVAASVIFATLLYHWEPAAIALGVFGYAFFFYALIGLRAKRAAIIGFGFGTGLAALNLRWLVAEFDTQWAGFVLFIVSVYGGIFMAAVAALLRCSLVRRSDLLGLVLTGLTLPAADYLRVIAPRFGIGNLHSAHLPVANVDLAQAAHWAGAAGLSALMAFSLATSDRRPQNGTRPPGAGLRASDSHHRHWPARPLLFQPRARFAPKGRNRPIGFTLRSQQRPRDSAASKSRSATTPSQDRNREGGLTFRNRNLCCFLKKLPRFR